MTSWVLLGLVAGGAAASLVVARLARGGAFLTTVLLASFGVRAGLAIAFYAISVYKLPLFPSLQLGDGFWQFALDAPWYHWNAMRIAEAFRGGTEIPELMVHGVPFKVRPDFYLAIAFFYYLAGAHPLVVPLVNSAAWSGISVLAYLLARTLKDETAGRVSVILVSVWPSPYLWSSQILKDTWVLFLLLSALTLCVYVLGGQRWLWLLAIAPLVVGVFLLVRFRFYLLPALVVAVGAATVVSLLRASPHRQWEKALRGLLLVPCLLGTFALAQSVNPVTLLSRSSWGKGDGDLGTASVTRPGLFFETFNVDRLASVRRGFRGAGGASNVDRSEFGSAWDMVVYLPRGLAYAVFAPFPWHLLSPAGDTGAFKWLSGIEVLLILMLLPFFLIGIVRTVRTAPPEAWLLLGFTAVLATLLGLAITNIGILFRLRLQFLIPMLVIVAAYAGSDLQSVAFRLLPSRWRR